MRLYRCKKRGKGRNAQALNPTVRCGTPRVQSVAVSRFRSYSLRRVKKSNNKYAFSYFFLLMFLLYMTSRQTTVSRLRVHDLQHEGVSLCLCLRNMLHFIIPYFVNAQQQSVFVVVFFFLFLLFISVFLPV